METIDKAINELNEKIETSKSRESAIETSIYVHKRSTLELMHFAAFGFIAPLLRPDQIMVVNPSNIEIKRKETSNGKEYFTNDFNLYLNENYSRRTDGGSEDNFRSISLSCSSFNSDNVEGMLRMVTVGKFAEMLANNGTMMLKALNDAVKVNAEAISKLYSELYPLERERRKMNEEVERMTVDGLFEEACRYGICVEECSWDVTQYQQFRRITKIALEPTSTGKTCRTVLEYIGQTWEEGVGSKDKAINWNGNVSTEKVRSFLRRVKKLS